MKSSRYLPFYFFSSKEAIAKIRGGCGGKDYGDDAFDEIDPEEEKQDAEREREAKAAAAAMAKEAAETKRQVNAANVTFNTKTPIIGGASASSAASSSSAAPVAVPFARPLFGGKTRASEAKTKELQARATRAKVCHLSI